jgi:HK97 family phage major capsid protein
VKSFNFKVAVLAILALACGAAFAGYPVMDLVPPDLLAALGALGGGMPFMLGETRSVAEQITAFEAKRKANTDQMDAIMAKAAEEGRTLEEAEEQEYDGLKADLAAVDKHLARLKDHEKAMVLKATPAGGSADGEGNLNVRGGVDVTNPGTIRAKSNLPKGLGFTRFALAMAHAKGNVMLAHEIAKERFKDTPIVSNLLKAAIAMGGTRDLALAAKTAVTSVSTTDTAITQYTDLENEFVDLLRPKMIMGRMEQLNRVPFLSRMGRQLTGVTGSFVGEGAPKPVQKQTYDNVTLGFAKVAVIVVLSDEAVKFSSIKAEMRARDDMVKGIATYIDKRFMDPSYSGVANVSPASITNGATRVVVRHHAGGDRRGCAQRDGAVRQLGRRPRDRRVGDARLGCAAPVDEAHHPGREGLPGADHAGRHLVRPAGDRVERHGGRRFAQRAADRAGDAGGGLPG